MLVLLNDCGPLLAASTQVADLLVDCPRLWVLATSRQVMGLTGEVVMSVDGLELPGQAPGQGAVAMLGCEAGQLFVDRARRAYPGLYFDDKGAAAVAESAHAWTAFPWPWSWPRPEPGL